MVDHIRNNVLCNRNALVIAIGGHVKLDDVTYYLPLTGSITQILCCLCRNHKADNRIPISYLLGDLGSTVIFPNGNLKAVILCLKCLYECITDISIILVTYSDSKFSWLRVTTNIIAKCGS